MSIKEKIRCVVFAGLVLLLPKWSISQEVIRVMPLGNSITRGVICQSGDVYNCDMNEDAVAVGYRERLHLRLDEAGYNTNFIGANSDGYAVMNDPEHSGFVGLRDDEIADILETGHTSSVGYVTPGPYLQSYPAHIILLHIGTNDVYERNYDASDITRILDEVDDFESSSGQPVVVFIARIISEQNFVCRSHAGTVLYNNDLTSIVQQRINNGDHIVLVDMECEAGLDYSTDMADQLHPNQTGYDKMGEYWFEVIDSYNAAPAISPIPEQNADRGSAFAMVSLDSYVTDNEDEDADLLWTFSPSNPDHFNVSIDENHNLIITPKNGDWSGSETINLVVTDQGKVLSQLKKFSTTTVQLTVNWIPEILGQQDITTNEDTPVTLNVNDIELLEPEKAPADLALLAMEGPDYTLESDTIIIPANDYYGTLTVPVQLTTGSYVSEIYNLIIEVTPQNDPPQIITSELSNAKTNNAYEFQIEVVDVDTTDNIIFSGSGLPDWLNINSASGLLSGVPARSDTGDFQFIINVSDGTVSTDKEYSLQVIFYNNSPAFTSVPEDTVKVGETYIYGALAEDVENDPLTYFANAIPNWADFSETSHVLIGTPTLDDIGIFPVMIGASDIYDTTYLVFTIRVIPNPNMDTEEHNIANEVTIYPNPVSSHLYIRIDHLLLIEDQLVFLLTDLQGHILHRVELNEPLTEIPVQEEVKTSNTLIYYILSTNSHSIVRSGKIVTE